jgi:phosphoglycolate phosphatase-like HAD superfamily hydrolase
MKTAGPVLAKIGVDPAKHVVITRDLVKYAKPDPDLFIAAANQLGVKIEDSVVVGDATWDMLASKRAKALGIGFLSGGYGETELREAGAYRIFEDPADMLAHIDEVGGRR